MAGIIDEINRLSSLLHKSCKECTKLHAEKQEFRLKIDSLEEKLFDDEYKKIIIEALERIRIYLGHRHAYYTVEVTGYPRFISSDNGVKPYLDWSIREYIDEHRCEFQRGVEITIKCNHRLIDKYICDYIRGNMPFITEAH